MNKTLKIIVTLVVIGFIVLFGGLYAITHMINPNQYKTKISAVIQKNTGRKIAIKGNIGWSIFPWISVDVNNVVIDNLPAYGSAPFASIGKAELSVKLLPLIGGNIDVDKIVLENASFNLAQNANKNNWTFIKASTNKVPKINQPKNKKAPAAKSSGGSTHFAISAIDIKNANIHYKDFQSGQNISLTKLNLRSTHISTDGTFPVNLSFVYTQTKPTRRITMLLTGHVDIDHADHRLAIKPLNLQVGDSVIDINLTADMQGGKQHISFDAKGNHIDLSDFTGLGRKQVSKPSKHTASPSKNTPNNSPIIPVSLLKSANWQGNVHINTLVIHKIKLNDITAKSNNNNANLQNSLTAKLYKGDLNAALNINAAGTKPLTTAHFNLTNVDMKNVVQAVTGKSFMTGTANLSNRIRTTGITSAEMKRMLSGQGKLSIKNGSIAGFNLDALVGQAAKIKSKASTKKTPTKGGDTEFSNLSGTYQISRGILTNNDLVLNTAYAIALGNGTINFPANNISYRLSAGPVAKKDINGKPKQPWSFPIRISGPISHPTIAPDFAAILTDIIKDQVTKSIGKDIGKMFKGLFN